MCRQPLLLVLLVVAAILPSQQVSAAIGIDAVSANWTQVQPNNVVGLEFIDSGPAGFEEIRWGLPVDVSPNPPIPKSGFQFVGSAPPMFSVAIGEVFSIGIFTHFNNPLQNTPPFLDPAAPTASITSAKLDLSMTLSIDGGPAMSLGPFGFVFSHQEAPVDDIVSLTNLVSSTSFLIGSDLYTLFLSGFVQGNLQPAISFSAAEGQTSEARIFGFFARAPINPPGGEIPEPLSVAIWGGLALFGLGAARRRKVA
jgi:hypothetical protein